MGSTSCVFKTRGPPTLCARLPDQQCCQRSFGVQDNLVRGVLVSKPLVIICNIGFQRKKGDRLWLALRGSFLRCDRAQVHLSELRVLITVFALTEARGAADLVDALFLEADWSVIGWSCVAIFFKGGDPPELKVIGRKDEG